MTRIQALRGRDETLRTSGICNEKGPGLYYRVRRRRRDVVPRARDAMIES
jgi:hypothetical protein